MWARHPSGPAGVYPDFSSGLQVLAAAANYIFHIKDSSAAAVGFLAQIPGAWGKQSATPSMARSPAIILII
jgi:hypothetical protein